MSKSCPSRGSGHKEHLETWFQMASADSLTGFHTTVKLPHMILFTACYYCLQQLRRHAMPGEGISELVLSKPQLFSSSRQGITRSKFLLQTRSQSRKKGYFQATTSEIGKTLKRGKPKVVHPRSRG